MALKRSVGADVFVIFMASEPSAHLGRRQIMSPNKIQCFPLTRICVAEGQPGPNNSHTSSCHQAAGERGPGGNRGSGGGAGGSRHSLQGT